MRFLRPAILGFAAVLASAALPAETLDEAVTHVKVRTVLLEHFGTDALGIGIQVSGGNVALSGTVEKPNTRELAPQAAASVKGVAKVENHIEVGNAPASKARSSASRAKKNFDNAVLEAKVKARLFNEVGGNALKIEVEASGGNVSLKGTVPTREIQTTAIETARKTKGVARVHSLLTVG